MDVPIERLLRELTPQVLGTVVRRFRDFAAAEDAVQEASARRGDAVAARGTARQSPRLADAGRLPANGRPHSQRIRSPPARKRGGAGGGSHNRIDGYSRLRRRKTTRWSFSLCAAILR